MFKKGNDPWIRTFTVSEPTRHAKGYTLYRVTSKVFPKNSIEAVTQVTVWKRYNDFKKLHKALNALHQGLYLKGEFPPFAKARFFGRFDDSIIEERMKCALQLLEFIAKYPPLFTSQVFVKFFEFGQVIELPNAQTEAFDAPVLQPMTLINSRLQNGSSNSLQVPNNTEDGETLGGIWQHHKVADDISIGSQNATEGEDEVEDDRTTFTDDDLSLPKLDLSEFDPVMQSSSYSGQSSTRPKDMCIDWLISAYQSCGQSRTESVESEGALSFPTPFDNIEDLELISNHSSEVKSLDYLYCDHHVEISKADDTSDSSVFDNLKEFDPLLTDATLQNNPPSDEAICTMHQTYIICAAKSVSAAQDAEMFGKYQEAFVYYKTAVDILLQGIRENKFSSETEVVQRKILQYLKRAEEIYENHLSLKPENDAKKTIVCETPKNSLRQPVINLTKYRVIGIINKVILVIDTITNITCVVKVLMKSPYVNQHSYEHTAPQDVRFMVQLYEVYETLDAFFLVLQYASGGKLWDHISSYLQRSPLSEANDAKYLYSKQGFDSNLANVYSGSKPNVISRPSEKDSEMLHSFAKQTDLSDSANSEDWDFSSNTSYAKLFKTYMHSAATENKARLAKCHFNFDSDIPYIDDIDDIEHITSEETQFPHFCQPVSDGCKIDLGNEDVSYNKDYLQKEESIDTIISNSKLLISDVNKLLYCSEDPSLALNKVKEIIDHTEKLESHCIIKKIENLNGKLIDNDDKATTNKANNLTMYWNKETGESILSTENVEHDFGRTSLSDIHPSSSTGDLEMSPSQKMGFTEAFAKLDSLASAALAHPTRLPENCVRMWAAEIVTALIALHKLGIIWQDLMPENILLGPDGHILLTYKGQWNAVNQIPCDYAKRNLYAAPEVGSIFPITAACDWWSLGAVLFELLIGKKLVLCYPCGITRHTDLSIPDDISLEASSLLKELTRAVTRVGATPELSMFFYGFLPDSDTLHKGITIDGTDVLDPRENEMEDEYIVEEFSDEDDYDGTSSSDDEFQAYIKKECGIVEVKDDFEDEMDKVITAHMRKLDRERSSLNHEPEKDLKQGSSSTESVAALRKNDTTSQPNVIGESSKEKENDELFYDPNMDDDDQKWIDDKRRSYIFPSSNTKVSVPSVKPLPNSDAVLNCPACLSLLCLDCQRHDIYKNQYRAMFVSNCNVLSAETLVYPCKKKQNRRDGNWNSDKAYNPVRCTVCNTDVAVYDTDEVYHFFNVLASYA